MEVIKVLKCETLGLYTWYFVRRDFSVYLNFLHFKLFGTERLLVGLFPKRLLVIIFISFED